MDELLQELKTAQELVVILKAKRQEAQDREAKLSARERQVELDEVAVKAEASALKEAKKIVEAKAKKVDLTLDLHAERNKVEQREADIENSRKKMMIEVQELQAKAKVAIQQALEIKESALSLQAKVEKEKSEYKTKILEEITKKVGK